MIVTLAFIAGAAPSPHLTVCDLQKQPAAYDGVRMELSARVIAEPHGYHLLDDACLPGSVRFVAAAQGVADARVGKMMGQIMSNRARGFVVLVGTFEARSDGNEIGRLKVEDVVLVKAGPEDR